MNISSCIPIYSIDAVYTVTKKAARGKEFIVSVSTDSKGSFLSHGKTPPTIGHLHSASVGKDKLHKDKDNKENSPLPERASPPNTAVTRKSVNTSGDDAASDVVDGKSKLIHLRATDPQVG
jgi:hypothetical protein